MKPDPNWSVHLQSLDWDEAAKMAVAAEEKPRDTSGIRMPVMVERNRTSSATNKNVNR